MIETTEDIEKLREKANKYDEINSRVIKKQIFKDPVDICIIKDVYEAMIAYRNEHSENQQRQLAVSCNLIKTILINAIK